MAKLTLRQLESTLVSELKIQNTVTTAELKQKIDIASFNEYEFVSSQTFVHYSFFLSAS